MNVNDGLSNVTDANLAFLFVSLSAIYTDKTEVVIKLFFWSHLISKKPQTLQESHWPTFLRTPKVPFQFPSGCICNSSKHRALLCVIFVFVREQNSTFKGTAFLCTYTLLRTQQTLVHLFGPKTNSIQGSLTLFDLGKKLLGIRELCIGNYFNFTRTLSLCKSHSTSLTREIGRLRFKNSSRG